MWIISSGQSINQVVSRYVLGLSRQQANTFNCDYQGSNVVLAVFDSIGNTGGVSDTSYTVVCKFILAGILLG